MAKDRWLTTRKPGDLIPRTGAPVTRPTAPSPIGTGVPPRSDVLQISPQVGTIPAGGIASIPEKPPETFHSTYDQETRDYWDKHLEHNALRQNQETGWAAERAYVLEAAGDVLRELTGPTGFTRTEGQEKLYLNEKLNRLKREARIVGADYMAKRLPDFGPSEVDEERLEKIRADIAQIKPKSEEADLAKMILDNIASGDPYYMLRTRIDQLRKKLDLLSEEEKELDRLVMGEGNVAEKPVLTPVELRSQINKKTATKLGTGLYNYRGFEIDRLGTEEGAEYVRWNILAPEIPGASQDFILDPENTFGDAKQVIDKWLASPEKYNFDYIFKFTDITKKAHGGFIDKPLYERTL
jgi:hypothetical protein